MFQNTAALRIIGYAGSLMLTLAAYFIIIRPESFDLGIRTAVLLILILAVLQFIVQFVFFLDLWREEGPSWNFNIFLCALSIIFVVVFFSWWIMTHLNARMM